MRRNAYTVPILVVFILVAVFGVPLMFGSPMLHGPICPFSSGQPVVCVASILEHMNHWQWAFAAVLFEILALCALALFFRRPLLAVITDTSRVPWRIQKHIPDRPTLFQELFARGILNRKEPHLFSVR